MGELLPCPFCGGEASWIAARQREDGTYYPASCGCRKCGIWRYGESDYGHGGFATEEDRERSMKQAITKWNTRTPEQAIAATLGRPKAKSHPYGYEHDTGCYDCTRCECGCINDISATYCNDCGGKIEIDESAEKEYYDGCRRTVFAVKHDDGSLELCERRYVPEDAATLGGGKLTAEQVREAIERHVKFYEGGDYDEQAIADELNAALGSGECEMVRVSNTTDTRKCSACGRITRFDYPLDRDELNYCPKCGAMVRKAVKR